MDQPDLILKPLAEDSSTKVLPPLTAAAAGFGRMSQESGFPPETQEPLETGGKAPQRDDFNGAFNLLSQHTVFQQAGGRYKFNAALSYDIGHRIVLDDGMTEVMSIVDDNTNNPNAGLGAGWREVGVIPPASESVAGIAEIATTVEVNAGLDDSKIVSPLKLAQRLGSKLTTNIFLSDTTNINGIGAYGQEGVYYQTANVHALPSLGYPVAEAGTLLATPSAYGLQQEYTTFTGRKFLRGLTTTFNGSGPWSAWVEFLAGGSSGNPMAAVPVGIPTYWPTLSVPAGCMQMAGQAFSATTYPILAQRYPSLALPDMRGIFIRGLDAGRGVDPNRQILSGQGAQTNNLDQVNSDRVPVDASYETITIPQDGSFSRHVYTGGISGTEMSSAFKLRGVE
ncbi:MAG TPA: tail fiber protein, partial [Pseudomonas sp.]|uniref:tail fiber protein n=1 Tax=Pseudomonas sp. TaxID=306 RepID=UPI002BBD6E5D